MISALLKLIDDGKDSALLRFSLGSKYISAGDLKSAETHLAEAVKQNPNYSAAWKLYGRVLGQLGAVEKSITVYQQGISVAEANGDKQVAKEMAVFLSRLTKK